MTDEQIADARAWAVEMIADAEGIRNLPINMGIAVGVILDLTHDLQVARLAIARYEHGFVEGATQ